MQAKVNRIVDILLVNRKILRGTIPKNLSNLRKFLRMQDLHQDRLKRYRKEHTKSMGI